MTELHTGKLPPDVLERLLERSVIAQMGSRLVTLALLPPAVRDRGQIPEDSRAAVSSPFITQSEQRRNPWQTQRGIS